MMRTLIFIAALASSSLALGDAPRVITLEEAVKTAEVRQPTVRQAHANTDVARARSDEARAPLLPQVSANLNYSRSTGNFAAKPGLLPGGSTPTGTTSWNTFNYFSNGVTAQQLIWDFNQTLGKYHSAEQIAQSQEDTEKATQLQTILTVRTAYFQARATKDLVAVAHDTLKAQDEHLKQTQGFVEVGTQPEIALATAQTNRANALVQVITAENNYDVAKAQLNQAMGVEQSTDYEVASEAIPPVADEDADTEKLLGEALGARPEFAAMEHQIQSQHYLLDSARGNYFPSLFASTGFTDNGPKVDGLIWNWNAQLTLSWNLFQGMLTPAQVREQEADIVGLEAQRDALRLQVRLQLEQARLAVRAAKAAVAAAGEAAVNASNQLKLAEGRFQTGVGSIIELADAQVAQTSAAAQKVQAEFNVSSARAQLLQALGRP